MIKVILLSFLPQGKTLKPNLRFYSTHNDPPAPQCGRCRVRTRAIFCFKSPSLRHLPEPCLELGSGIVEHCWVYVLNIWTAKHVLGNLKFNQKVANLLKSLRIFSKGCEFTQKVANLLKRLQIYSKGFKFTQKVANLLKRKRIYSNVCEFT